MTASVITAIISACVSGIVAFLVWKQEKAFEQLKADNDSQRQTQVKMHTLERDLQLAMADTTKLMAKKLDNSIAVNGDLLESASRLAECQEALQNYTNELGIRRVEK